MPKTFPKIAESQNNSVESKIYTAKPQNNLLGAKRILENIRQERLDKEKKEADKKAEEEKRIEEAKQIQKLKDQEEAAIEAEKYKTWIENVKDVVFKLKEYNKNMSSDFSNFIEDRKILDELLKNAPTTLSVEDKDLLEEATIQVKYIEEEKHNLKVCDLKNKLIDLFEDVNKLYETTAEKINKICDLYEQNKEELEKQNIIYQLNLVVHSWSEKIVTAQFPSTSHQSQYIDFFKKCIIETFNHFIQNHDRQIVAKLITEFNNFFQMKNDSELHKNITNFIQVIFDNANRTTVSLVIGKKSLPITDEVQLEKYKLKITEFLETILENYSKTQDITISANQESLQSKSDSIVEEFKEVNEQIFNEISKIHSQQQSILQHSSVENQISDLNTLGTMLIGATTEPDHS